LNAVSQVVVAGQQIHQCREIVAGRFIFPHKDWSGISEGVKDLIRKMLVTDPEKRYTAEDVLRHPWVHVKPADPLAELPETIIPSLRSYHEGSMKSLGSAETDIIEIKRKKSFEMMRLASEVQVCSGRRCCACCA
jgi:serine/threonine protein kinase